MFERKEKEIEFAIEFDFHEVLQPAKKYIPDWYKRNPHRIEGSPIAYETMKQCVPFLESMTNGYMATLWCDIYVDRTPDNKIDIKWKSRLQRSPIEPREIVGTEELVPPAGHSPQRFAFHIPYYVRTPKNYSCLITHPFNRYDLPFTTLTGIVDTHEVMYAGNIPFFIKSDFIGLIPKGTPIFQLIPFAKESWISKENSKLIELGRTNERKALAVFAGWYKNNVWQKKTYS